MPERKNVIGIRQYRDPSRYLFLASARYAGHGFESPEGVILKAVCNGG